MMYIRQMQILVQAQICTWLIVYNRVGWLLLDSYTLYIISLNSSMMYIRQMQILVQAQICTWLIVYTKRPELAPLPGAFWSFSFHYRTFFLSTALYSSIRKLSCSIPFPVSRSFSFNSSKSGTFTFSSFSIVSFEIVFAYSSYFS